MSAYEALLDVQGHDTAVDQLHHRRAHLPEREQRAATAAAMTQVQAELDGARARRAAVVARQTALEETIVSVEHRIAEIDGRLYSGQVTATRDILAMTAEIESLKARRSSLEDEELAALEEEEPLAAEVARLEARLEGLGDDATRLEAAIAAAEGEIDREAAAVLDARAVAAAAVPADLLATYERLRAALGGIGAARLVGSSCSGCHLMLPAQEVARLKREPPDALVLCDQCGRILVR